MARVRHRGLIALLALALAAPLSACGKGAGAHSTVAGPTRKLAPVAAQGAVSLSTRNTTRLGGGNAVVDAASVARAVYPGLTTETRPRAVVLVNGGDWPAALAASELASAPAHAPILFSEGNSLPEVSRQSLEAMRPIGDSALGGAQVISIDTAAPLPAGLVSRSIAAGEPAVTAAAIAHALIAATGATPRNAIVLAANTSHALQMPAAGLAAESGSPILFVTRSRVPAASAKCSTRCTTRRSS